MPEFGTFWELCRCELGHSCMRAQSLGRISRERFAVSVPQTAEHGGSSTRRGATAALRHDGALLDSVRALRQPQWPRHTAVDSLPATDLRAHASAGSTQASRRDCNRLRHLSPMRLLDGDRRATLKGTVHPPSIRCPCSCSSTRYAMTLRASYAEHSTAGDATYGRDPAPKPRLNEPGLGDADDSRSRSTRLSNMVVYFVPGQDVRHGKPT